MRILLVRHSNFHCTTPVNQALLTNTTWRQHNRAFIQTGPRNTDGCDNFRVSLIRLTNRPSLGAQTASTPFGTKPNAGQYVAILQFDGSGNTRGSGVTFIKKLQRRAYQRLIEFHHRLDSLTSSAPEVRPYKRPPKSPPPSPPIRPTLDVGESSCRYRPRQRPFQRPGKPRRSNHPRACRRFRRR